MRIFCLASRRFTQNALFSLKKKINFKKTSATKLLIALRVKKYMMYFFFSHFSGVYMYLKSLVVFCDEMLYCQKYMYENHKGSSYLLL